MTWSKAGNYTPLQRASEVDQKSSEAQEPARAAEGRQLPHLSSAAEPKTELRGEEALFATRTKALNATAHLLKV